MANNTIIVLNDGETFSHINECKVYNVPADWDVDRIETALAEGEIDSVMELRAVEEKGN